MKQTVEEAAREYMNILPVKAAIKCGDIEDLESHIKVAFKNGAEWQAKQSPWISVKERLPENDDDYYIGLDTTMQPHGCDIVEFNPITKKFSDRYRIVNITHWMMIPKSPEETKNKNY